MDTGPVKSVLILEDRMLNTETLGVDIGGVIIDRTNDRTDTSFFQTTICGLQQYQVSLMPYVNSWRNDSEIKYFLSQSVVNAYRTKPCIGLTITVFTI